MALIHLAPSTVRRSMQRTGLMQKRASTVISMIIVYYCWTLLDAFDALDAFERFWMSLRSWPHFFSPLSMAFGTSQHQRLRR